MWMIATYVRGQHGLHLADGRRLGEAGVTTAVELQKACGM